MILSGVAEPPPWVGPLGALARLMRLFPNERLLVCAVDMPWLDGAVLQALAAAGTHREIVVAHDGLRRQPLPGLYPAMPDRRLRLEARLAAGEHGLQRWLEEEGCRTLQLPAAPLHNGNRPQEWGGEL